MMCESHLRRASEPGEQGYIFPSPNASWRTDKLETYSHVTTQLAESAIFLPRYVQKVHRFAQDTPGCDPALNRKALPAES
jgi:hypothetical protein